MRFTGLVGPSYKLRSVNVDCQRCINLFPEMNEMGNGKGGEIAALVATPGLQTLAEIGDGPIRGIYESSLGVLYVVSGGFFYQVNADFTYTQLGQLQTLTGQVSIADNGLHVVVVDGGYGYVCTLASSTFTQISDENFLGADVVVFQDGYFIFNRPDTGFFIYSGLNDVTFDGLDIQSSEGSPDNIVTIISDHRDLWVFNEQTTEVFYNSGGAENVFARMDGAYIEHGCAAKFSVAKGDNTVFWLGKDKSGAGIVYAAKGYQPQRISTHAVEFEIQSYENMSDATAFTYQDSGHLFYVLNFPSARTTWVYDVSTSLWHERAYANQGQLERHRANNHAFAYGKHVVGDYDNGKLYHLSNYVYSDDGAPIVRRRVAPHLYDGATRMFYHSLQLDIESGTGLDGIQQGTDPQAMLRWSDDGGHSWSGEKWVSFGKIGHTKKRALWRRLGASRDRVFEITISDPVRVTIIGAELTIEKGLG